MDWGRIVCVDVLWDCEFVLLSVMVFIIEFVFVMEVFELVLFVDKGLCIFLVVVIDVLFCWIDMFVVLEKKGVLFWIRGISCVLVDEICWGVIMGIVKDNGRGDVCVGDDKDDRVESVVRGEGIGKRFDGVNGVVKVGVVGGRVRGVMLRGLLVIVVICCGGVVEVVDVLWFKVVVVSVVSVLSILEFCGLEVLEVFLLFDIIIESKKNSLWYDIIEYMLYEMYKNIVFNKSIKGKKCLNLKFNILRKRIMLMVILVWIRFIVILWFCNYIMF